MRVALPRGRAAWIVGALTLACLLGGGQFLAGSREPQPGPEPLSPASATVVRTTLLDARTATGTLGFGDPVDAQFISRARSGIVTWIAPEGTIVSRGQPLFAIDGQPVVLFYGELPLFRSLRFSGDAFTAFEWLELNNARDEEHRAELNLEARRAQQAEAQARLKEVRVHVEDGAGDNPATPQFIRLQQAVAAARDRLQRIGTLAESRYASQAELQQAGYDLAAARAELDAARRERTQQLAAAQSAVADAKLAVHHAERSLRDARDVRDALLASANENADVAILRTNLAELGYAGRALDAVRNWQRKTGRSATGLVEPGHIVVAAGPVRVAAHLAGVGDVVYSRMEGQNDMAPTGNTSSQVLRYTSTSKVATVPLELADHDYARTGDAVTVTLPNNVEVAGVISKVSAQFDEQGRANAEIAIPSQQELGPVEAAAVEVEFVVGRRADVLAVPVIALVAMAQGGFGVELVTEEGSRVVPVETGLFARGNVEISGDGIAEGARVNVPQ